MKKQLGKDGDCARRGKLKGKKKNQQGQKDKRKKLYIQARSESYTKGEIQRTKRMFKN